MPRSGTLFLADMHLCPGERPAQNAALASLLRGPGQTAEQAILLGDTFNCWFERSGRHVGDYAECFALFREATDAGLSIHHISGNRDFVIGANPADGWEGFLGPHIPNAGSVLLNAGIRPHGTRFVFTQDGSTVHCLHGDTLCTNDLFYQTFRWLVQGPIGRLLGRITPFFIGNAIVGYFQTHKLVAEYMIPKTGKDIVTESAAEEVADGATLVVCGHVHHEDRRPLDHAGHTGELCILPPWGTSGKYGTLHGGQFEVHLPPDGLRPRPDSTEETQPAGKQ